MVISAATQRRQAVDRTTPADSRPAASADPRPKPDDRASSGVEHQQPVEAFLHPADGGRAGDHLHGPGLRCSPRRALRHGRHRARSGNSRGGGPSLAAGAGSRRPPQAILDLGGVRVMGQSSSGISRFAGHEAGPRWQAPGRSARRGSARTPRSAARTAPRRSRRRPCPESPLAGTGEGRLDARRAEKALAGRALPRSQQLPRPAHAPAAGWRSAIAAVKVIPGSDRTDPDADRPLGERGQDVCAEVVARGEPAGDHTLRCRRSAIGSPGRARPAGGEAGRSGSRERVGSSARSSSPTPLAAPRSTALACARVTRGSNYWFYFKVRVQNLDTAFGQIWTRLRGSYVQNLDTAFAGFRVQKLDTAPHVQNLDTASLRTRVQEFGHGSAGPSGAPDPPSRRHGNRPQARK